MNNMIPPEGRIANPNKRDPLGNPEDDHILPDLLAALEREDTLATLTAAQRRKAAVHLRQCATCRLSLSLLGEAPGEVVASRHARNRSHKGPDDADLALYISFASATDVATADDVFPRVKSHLKRCSICAALVRDELNDPIDPPITHEQPTDPADPPAVAATPTAELPATPSPSSSPGAQWVEIRRPDGARARMLLTPYIIEVGDWTVSISSAALNPRIEVEYASAPGFRDQPGAGVVVVKQEQSFTVDLRDDPHATSWVQVKVHTQAVGTTRLICHLTSYRVTSAEDPGQRVGGVFWLLERAGSGGQRELLAADSTAPDTVSKITSKARGDLLLTLQADGRDWVVPLVIQAANKPPSLDTRRP